MLRKALLFGAAASISMLLHSPSNAQSDMDIIRSAETLCGYDGFQPGTQQFGKCVIRRYQYSKCSVQKPTFQQQTTALAQSVAGVGTPNFQVSSLILEGIMARQAQRCREALN